MEEFLKRLALCEVVFSLVSYWGDDKEAQPRTAAHYMYRHVDGSRGPLLAQNAYDEINVLRKCQPHT